MIFVDTGAWAAFFVPADPSHRRAVTWMQENRQPLITTDYVLDELLTLLKTRYGVSAAIEAGERLWAEEFAEVLFLTTADIRQAWAVFRGHRDKGWSFTDCASYVVMRRLRISQTFAFDRHFSQMLGIHRAP
mgnify:CR=1 FL=1